MSLSVMFSFKFQPLCSTCQNFPPFHGRLLLHCTYLLHFVFHSFFSGHLGCFNPMAVVNSAAVNVGMQIPLKGPTVNSSGCVTRSAIAGSYGSSRVNFFFNF